MKVPCYCSAGDQPHEHDNHPDTGWPCPLRPVSVDDALRHAAAVGQLLNWDALRAAGARIADAVRAIDLGAPDSDPVSRPSHYVGPGRCQECGEAIECRDVVVHMPWAIGSAMKYLWRAGRKTDDAITDLRKAIECIQMEITRRERLAVLAERAEREW